MASLNFSMFFFFLFSFSSSLGCLSPTGGSQRQESGVFSRLPDLFSGLPIVISLISFYRFPLSPSSHGCESRGRKKKGKLAEFFKRDVVFSFFLVPLVIIFPICCPAFFSWPSPAKPCVSVKTRVSNKKKRKGLAALASQCETGCWLLPYTQK